MTDIQIIKDDDKLEELNKLENYLKDNNYNYRRVDIYEERVTTPTGLPYTLKYPRHQLIVYGEDGRQWDAICQQGSYGYDSGLLEVYGDIVNINDDVEGFLTTDELITRLEGKVK